MLGGGLLNKQLEDKKKCSVKIPAIRQQLKPIFIFPLISLWKLYCHSKQSAYATAIKTKQYFCRDAMNISAKFQIIHNTASEDFLNIFHKFSLLVAVITNQIERFGQKVNVW